MADPMGSVPSPVRRQALRLGAGALAWVGLGPGTLQRRVDDHARSSRLMVYLASGDDAVNKGLSRLTARLEARHPKVLASWTIRHHLFPSQASPAQQQAAVDGAMALQPALFVAPTGAAAAAVIRSPKGVPLVFASFSELPGFGQGATPPSGHPHAVTGISLVDQLHAKRLELLLEAFPRTRRVGVLADRAWMDERTFAAQVLAEAPPGLRVSRHDADHEEELQRLLDGPAFRSQDAWYIPPSFLSYRFEQAIIDALARWRLPAIHSTVAEVRQGALMAYAPDHSFVYEALADLAARVCQGEDAGRIPIARPFRFTLAVRPRAAPAELRLPPALVRRSDQVF